MMIVSVGCIKRQQLLAGQLHSLKMSSEDDMDIKSRKFTLHKDLDNKLEEYADNYYQGNKSRFLRAAIKDHIRTLEGEDEITLREVLSELRQLRGEFEEQMQSLEEHTQSSHTAQANLKRKQTNQKQTDGSINEDRVKKVSRIVHRCLEGADSQSLTLSEIVSRVEEESYEVQAGLEELLERDWVVADDQDDSTQYRIRKPT